MPGAAVNSGRKARVATSFGAVSEGYDAGAGLQREVAGRLAERISGMSLPPRPRVLEVGCGTGFLTKALRPHLEGGPPGLEGGQWVVSDIAPPMVAGCRRELENHDDVLFLAMDAERPAVAGTFDLICSNLAFQWFDDLEGCLRGLTGLLAPGGTLAFSTLSAGTMEEWRRAHLDLDLTPATPDYPDAKTLAAMTARASGGDFAGTVEEEEIVRVYESAHAFVATLKAIGAHTPAPGKRPLPAGTFRRVLRRLDDGGRVGMTYRVAYGLYARQG